MNEISVSNVSSPTIHLKPIAKSVIKYLLGEKSVKLCSNKEKLAIFHLTRYIFNLDSSYQFYLANFDQTCQKRLSLAIQGGSLFSVKKWENLTRFCQSLSVPSYSDLKDVEISSFLFNGLCTG